MRHGLPTIGLGLLLAALSVSLQAMTKGGSSLAVVEGIILDIGSQPGEGGLEVVTARLSTERDEGREIDLLLAPASVLEEPGFTLQPGDRLKARVFTPDDGPATVHKVFNQTQGSMIRLRTLRQIPLWNGAGVWLGGPGAGRRGGQGRHQPPQGPPGGSGPPR